MKNLILLDLKSLIAIGLTTLLMKFAKNFIWAYPRKLYTPNTVIVMPEWGNMSYDSLRDADCYGVCSDYVGMLK